MERAGIRNRFVGNPMMDDLEGTGETFNLPPSAPVVGLLPGSRADMHENALTLLAVAAAAAGQPGLAAPLHFLFAAPSGMDPDEILRHVGEGRRAPGWRRAPLLPDDPARGIIFKLAHAGGPAASGGRGPGAGGSPARPGNASAHEPGRTRTHGAAGRQRRHCRSGPRGAATGRRPGVIPQRRYVPEIHDVCPPLASRLDALREV